MDYPFHTKKIGQIEPELLAALQAAIAELPYNPHPAFGGQTVMTNQQRTIPDALIQAVDKAESDMENADLVNRKAVKKLSIVAKELDIKLIHISTDYVFDGKNFKPYLEEYQTNPQSVYGKTKLDGENEIRDINPLIEFQLI
jgi:dTDP-4-dehydrorhamnose reductase